MFDYLRGRITKATYLLDGTKPHTRLDREGIISNLFRAKMTPELEERADWSEIITDKLRRTFETIRYSSKRHEGD